jgi:VIT1/CCC1 family predicted Fe2+/Mn2+ transporter
MAFHQRVLGPDEATTFFDESRLGSMADDADEYVPEQDDFSKSFIYGGLDGIITTFVTVAACAGAELSAGVVIILGIAHLLADGLSMGMGDVLSTQAETEFHNVLRFRQRADLDRNMRSKVNDMVDVYVEKGLSRDDAKKMIGILSKYDRAFLELVMVEEHGLLPQEEADSALKAGAVTMLSFAIFGITPLVIYLVSLIPSVGKALDAQVQLCISLGVTVLSLFVLGALKGKYVDVGSTWHGSALVMTATGGFAASVGYIVGIALKGLVHTIDTAA